MDSPQAPFWTTASLNDAFSRATDREPLRGKSSSERVSEREGFQRGFRVS